MSVRVEPIAPYIPPSGFEAVAPSRDAAMSSSQFFSNQNLAGKQVWYITAPASVPISAIKKVSLQDVSLGKPSVFLNGQDYGFVENKTEDRGHAKIMIPDKSSSTYRLGKAGTICKDYFPGNSLTENSQTAHRPSSTSPANCTTS